MPKLIVVTREGDASSLDGAVGQSVMEVIRNSGLDELLALCGGRRSRATCHVYVEPATACQLPAMSGDEADLLDGSGHRRADSRLSCQIRFGNEPDGLKVTVAPEDQVYGSQEDATCRHVEFRACRQTGMTSNDPAGRQRLNLLAAQLQHGVQHLVGIRAQPGRRQTIGYWSRGKSNRIGYQWHIVMIRTWHAQLQSPCLDLRVCKCFRQCVDRAAGHSSRLEQAHPVLGFLSAQQLA